MFFCYPVTMIPCGGGCQLEKVKLLSHTYIYRKVVFLSYFSFVCHSRTTCPQSHRPRSLQGALSTVKNAAPWSSDGQNSEAPSALLSYPSQAQSHACQNFLCPCPQAQVRKNTNVGVSLWEMKRNRVLLPTQLHTIMDSPKFRKRIQKAGSPNGDKGLPKTQ